MATLNRGNALVIIQLGNWQDFALQDKITVVYNTFPQKYDPLCIYLNTV